MQGIKDYLDHTTIHGFKYILSGETFLIWVLSILAAFASTLFLSYSYISDAIHDPITTLLSTVDVREVPFPAVTVDAGKVVNPMGYPRKALARTSVKETDEGTGIT